MLTVKYSNVSNLVLTSCYNTNCYSRTPEDAWETQAKRWLLNTLKIPYIRLC